MTQGHWIGYARAGTEFAAQAKISAAGITCLVPRKVDMIRQGKRRWPDPITSPALRNYVFFTGTNDDWQAVHALNLLSATMQHIGARAWDSITAYHARTEADYDARMAQIMANQRVAEYTPGELLHIIAGPLAGQMATFTRMIERADEPFPEIEASVEIMGGHVKTRLDPLHASPVVL